MSKPKGKKWSELTTAELAEATTEYDREMPGLPGKPLTPAQKALHRKAKKVGRPKKGAGSAVVGVSVERGLLKRADALAKRRGIGRSQLFVDALQAELSRAKAG